MMLSRECGNNGVTRFCVVRKVAFLVSTRMVVVASRMLVFDCTTVISRA